MQEQLNGNQEPKSLEQTATPAVSSTPVTPTPVAEAVVEPKPVISTPVVEPTPEVSMPTPTVEPLTEPTPVVEAVVEPTSVTPTPVVESTPEVAMPTPTVEPVVESSPEVETPVIEQPVTPEALTQESTPTMATSEAPLQQETPVVSGTSVPDPLASAPAPTALQTPSAPEEKKTEKKKLPIVLIIVVLLVIIAGVVVFIFKDSLFGSKEPEVPAVETDANAVSYCIDNIETIGTMINEVQRNGFLNKYYHTDIVLTEKDQIDCNQSILNTDDSTYIMYAVSSDRIKTNAFKYNKTTNTIIEINLEDNKNKESSYPMNYALKIVKSDLDKFKESNPDTQIGTYSYNAVDETYEYDGGDLFKVVVAGYGSDTVPEGPHYYTYIVDFKNKTFEKEDN